MSSTPDLGMDARHWALGGIAGLIAGFVFGAIMSHTEMMEMVAMLLDLEEVWHGWLFHYVISIAFGLIFVPIAAATAVSAWVNRPSRGAVAGGIYGIVAWVVGASIVMPLWMGAIHDVDPSVPDFNYMSFVGHIAYGVVLGVLYPMLVDHEPA